MSRGFRLVIPGDPVPKSWEPHREAMELTPQARAAQLRIAELAERMVRGLPGRYPLTGPFAVRLTFFESIKPTHEQADIDNCVKLVLDGLAGVYFADDKQVTKVTAVMCRGRSNPRTELIVTRRRE